jgi:uncharacterized membrane protein
MNARAERWSQPETRLVAVALAGAVFLVAWGLIHRGFYAERPLVDTPVYQSYGDAVLDGAVPYRDFAVEYPPGALPVFVVPSLFGDYAEAFAWLMAALGVALVAAVASIRPAAAAFVAVSPLLVGSLLLSRFDLWPAALTAAALAALLRDRHRLGWGLLGAAVAAKLYPLVLVPLALAWTRRRGSLRDALVGLGVVGAIVLPFAVLAPGGVWHSVYTQASRPLQVESLGAALVKTFGHPHVVTSHGSQNVTGYDALAALTTVAQMGALAALWVAFARRPVDLPRYAAACVCAFVAFAKVLSPQFLVWLVPLVPLVRGRRGIAATALLAAALVLTQVWFPARYWQYVYDSRFAAVVLGRDLVLVALLLVLAVNRPIRESHA